MEKIGGPTEHEEIEDDKIARDSHESRGSIVESEVGPLGNRTDEDDLQKQIIL